MESQSGSPTITLPGGYSPEEGKQEGEEVQALITFKIGPNGTAEIISVDGAKYGAAAKPKPAPDQGTKILPVNPEDSGPSSFTDRLMQAKQRMGA